MKKFRKVLLYYYTLKDIGFIRIYRRILFTCRQILEKKFFKFIFIFYNYKNPFWNYNILSNLTKIDIRKKDNKNKKKLL